MRKTICAILLLMPVLLLSQDEKGNIEGKKISTNIPVLSQYSESFAIRHVNFNKQIDYSGKGEVLEVEFVLENLTDDPMDFYIFTIATFEKKEKSRSSFERPIPEKERVRTFVTCPDDINNFIYPVTDSKGNIVKDEKGQDKIKYVKFPKDPKKGVDPNTGKAYHLEGKLTIRNTHLSMYRTNFYFFNEVAVLIFDFEGKPVYRQLYELRGVRR